MIHTLIDRLLIREGGFSDHPDDTGGATNFGITIAVLSDWRGSPQGVADVRHMDREEARQIYYHKYWVGPRFHTLGLHPVVTEMLFDTAVHSGQVTAVKLLQRCVGVHQDGVIGPVTQKATKAMRPNVLAAAYIGERVAYIGRIITKNPSQAVFAHGWANRMKELIKLVPLA